MNSVVSRHDPPARRKTADRQPRPRVLPEPLFRSMLRTQQKRAHRAGERLAVLMVVAEPHRDADSPEEWAAVLDALGVAMRSTDIVGWFAWRTRIGVILTETFAFDAARARDFETRLREELARRLDTDMTGHFSVHLHLEPDDAVLDEACSAPHATYVPVKRALDVIASSALLFALVPLFLLIALLVKASSRGPVLFRQVRVGRGLKPFNMLKFRTMYTGATSRVHEQYISWFIASSAAEGKDVRVFKLANDPRITRIGRFLRKTSLDELPQLWNVLRGDMSLVGPRPPLPYEVAQYKPWHCRRVVEATPGITGLWQVSGRSRTTFDDMVRLDLRYARSCSLLTDLRILLATPRAVVTGNGAC